MNVLAFTFFEFGLLIKRNLFLQQNRATQLIKAKLFQFLSQCKIVSLIKKIILCHRKLTGFSHVKFLIRTFPFKITLTPPIAEKFSDMFAHPNHSYSNVFEEKNINSKLVR